MPKSGSDKTTNTIFMKKKKQLSLSYFSYLFHLANSVEIYIDSPFQLHVEKILLPQIGFLLSLFHFFFENII
jgi:hypothetical protein